jgi:beta-galactosidase
VAWRPIYGRQTPYLYNLVSTVTNQPYGGGRLQTPVRCADGVVSTVHQWCFINGQHVEIQGMCNHQDHAGVGSALPDRLQYFRIEKLKEMGVNAYRTSHNAPTEELLEACDQLGMLVLDETRRMGSDPESLGQLQRMVLRDRNHPSVFCWSLCNEEWTMQGSSSGPGVIQAMQNLVHSLDSTRLCTAALNGSLSGVTFAYVLDVKGLNYNIPGNLDSYHSSNPTLPIIGTEVGTTVTTRGIYTNDTVNGYVASYDIIRQRPAQPGDLGRDGGSLVAVLLCPSLVVRRVRLDRF